MATPLGRVPVFARPDYAERVFELDGVSLLGGAAQAPAVAFAGDQSLMKLDGQEHREHREIVAGSMRPSELPGGGSDLLAQVRRAVAGWPVGRRFDLGAALDRLALDLSANLGLGELPEGIAASARRTLRDLRRATTPSGLILAALVPRSRGHFEHVRATLEGHLEDRIGRGDHTSPCVFHRLASRCSARGARLGALGLRDEMMTLFVAMTGGLSCSMKHSFYWALRMPGIGPRVRAATARMVADDDPGALATDPFLDAVCKEVLRLCPDIPFAVRRAVADVAIGPWRLPAGTTVGVGIYLLHRRESSFPQAERFLPERFLTARPSRFEYLPFGGGRRGCVAAPFFSFVQKLILATAFERHQLRLCDRRDNPVTSLGIVSTPARPLWAVAEPHPRSRTMIHPGVPVGAASHGLAPKAPVGSGGRWPVN